MSYRHGTGYRLEEPAYEGVTTGHCDGCGRRYSARADNWYDGMYLPQPRQPGMGPGYYQFGFCSEACLTWWRHHQRVVTAQRLRAFVA